MSATPWLLQRERGSIRLLRLMQWLTLRLGLGVGHLLLYPIAAYFFVLAPEAGRASRDYLRRVLGRAPTAAERFRHLFTFAETIMDRILVRLGRTEALVVEIRGRDVVERLVGEGRGFLLLGAHLGCFEVLRTLGGRGCPVPIKMAMYAANAGGLHGFLAGLDPKAEADVIRIGVPEAALRIKEAVDAGALVGILGDRSVAGDKLARVDFLGGPANFPTGPLVLASLLGVPVVLCFGIHTETRRYAVDFELFAERISLDRRSRDADLAVWLGRYARALEARCRAHPFNWFNFYDFWSAGADRPGAR